MTDSRLLARAQAVESHPSLPVSLVIPAWLCGICRENKPHVDHTSLSGLTW